MARPRRSAKKRSTIRSCVCKTAPATSAQLQPAGFEIEVRMAVVCNINVIKYCLNMRSSRGVKRRDHDIRAGRCGPRGESVAAGPAAAGPRQRPPAGTRDFHPRRAGGGGRSGGRRGANTYLYVQRARVRSGPPVTRASCLLVAPSSALRGNHNAANVD